MILLWFYDYKGMTEGFQISRHWRLNSQRYRLQGVRHSNGDVRLAARVVPGEISISPELEAWRKARRLLALQIINETADDDADPDSVTQVA